jgi:hypothetical protein
VCVCVCAFDRTTITSSSGRSWTTCRQIGWISSDRWIALASAPPFHNRVLVCTSADRLIDSFVRIRSTRVAGHALGRACRFARSSFASLDDGDAQNKALERLLKHRRAINTRLTRLATFSAHLSHPVVTIQSNNRIIRNRH